MKGLLSSSTFEELLNKDSSVKIHTRNLQILATEMFKIRNGIATPLIGRGFSNCKSKLQLKKYKRI